MQIFFRKCIFLKLFVFKCTVIVSNLHLLNLLFSGHCKCFFETCWSCSSTVLPLPACKRVMFEQINVDFFISIFDIEIRDNAFLIPNGASIKPDRPTTDSLVLSHRIRQGTAQHGASR